MNDRFFVVIVFFFVFGNTKHSQLCCVVTQNNVDLSASLFLCVSQCKSVEI